ncbi:hypothetical protein, partial [Burkholderia cenocepacia]|uniref:hypothetical protein n=1 Tax=Burkholderia cenocepacia TaxID=95486 RepID=UPI001E5EBCAA
DLLFRKALLHVRLLLRKRTLLDSGWLCLQGTGQMHLARRDACTPATNVAEITNLLFFVCVGGHQGRGEKSPWTTSPE